MNLNLIYNQQKLSIYYIFITLFLFSCQKDTLIGQDYNNNSQKWFPISNPLLIRMDRYELTPNQKTYYIGNPVPVNGPKKCIVDLSKGTPVYSVSYDQNSNPSMIIDIIHKRLCFLTYMPDGTLNKRVKIVLTPDSKLHQYDFLNSETTIYNFTNPDYCTYLISYNNIPQQNNGFCQFGIGGMIIKDVVFDNYDIHLSENTDNTCIWTLNLPRTQKSYPTCNTSPCFQQLYHRSLRPSPFFIPFIGSNFSSKIEYRSIFPGKLETAFFDLNGCNIKNMWLFFSNLSTGMVEDIAYYKFIYE